MVVVTHQREKCIGCHYCVDAASEYWRMSKKDGKSTLIDSVNKRGFHTARLETEAYETNKRASESCPVKIISVKRL